MRIDLISLLEADTLTALFDISNDDIAYMVCIGTWVLLLTMPLHQVDRRDPITFVTYLTFLISSGVVLFMIVPAMTMQREINYIRDLFIILIVTTIVAVRWIIGNDLESNIKKVSKGKAS